MKEKLCKIWLRVRADLYDYRYVIILFSICYFAAHKFLNAFCPLVAITGFPCPGCGMTRAVLFLLTGQWERSFRCHPMALPFLLFGIYFIGSRYVMGKPVKYFQQILGVLLFIMIIVYLFRMKTIFPDRPPMSYTRNNLLENIIPFYREVLRKVFHI